MLYAPCPCQCLGASAMKFSLLRSTATPGSRADHITAIFEAHKDPVRPRSNGTFPFPCTKIPKVGFAPD